MAVSRGAVENGGIYPDWCPEEYFEPAEGPAYAIILNHRKDPDARNFVSKAVIFYQKSFNRLYPDLATNKDSQKAFDNAVTEQEPGGFVIYQALRRRQLPASSKIHG